MSVVSASDINDNSTIISEDSNTATQSVASDMATHAHTSDNSEVLGSDVSISEDKLSAGGSVQLDDLKSLSGDSNVGSLALDDDNSLSAARSDNILEEDDADHTIYVSPYGPNDADGTMLKSYNTLKKALDSIANKKEHYTIIIREGNYTGANNTALKIKGNITIKAYDGAKPIFNFYSNAGNVWNITGSNITIEGLKFINGYRFFDITNANNIVLNNNKFNGSYSYSTSPLISISNSHNVNVSNSIFNNSRATYNTSSDFSISRSDVVIEGNSFINSGIFQILKLSYSNATINNNVFNNLSGNYVITSDYSNSIISNNAFSDRISNFSAIVLSKSNSTIVDNSFNNITATDFLSTGAAISSLSDSVVNISSNRFEGNTAPNGGAIYINSSDNIIENNIFNNNYANYYGGSIFNNGNNLTLINNTITNSDANAEGRKIYNNGTINTVNITFLNNETVNAHNLVNIPINVTDDMGNEILGKSATLMFNEMLKTVDIVEDTVYSTNISSIGTFLVNGTYNAALNSNVKTGVLFIDEGSYSGPFYVDVNGNDDNNGDENHPLKTISEAVFRAGLSNKVPVIYLYEGTYYVNDLTLSKPVNITGLGNVTFDAQNNGRILNVTGSNVNISNINFINSNIYNETIYSSDGDTQIYGGAVYWSGNNGTLSNSTFNNNSITAMYSYGGALYWSGANGTVKNVNFSNNYVTDPNNDESAKSQGGALYWSGENGAVINSSFEDNYAKHYGGAVYWSGYNGTLSNSTLNSNNASKYAGAVCWYGDDGNISNNIFDNNSAVDAATIFVYGSNLYLSGNTISNPNGSNYKYIYLYSGSINNPLITILDNSTICTSLPYFKVTVNVTDDMGNPIYGGTYNLILNGTILTSRYNTEISTFNVNYPGIGEYLINASFIDPYVSQNTTVRTAVINWTGTPYYGPYYVSPNGSDANNGTKDSPFATIETAIKAASIYNTKHAIYIMEGTYKENGLNVSYSMNIIGLGNVTIDAEFKNLIFNVSAFGVNISNINFINGNSSSSGGAIYWTGSSGKLSNSSFVNNTAALNGGAIYNHGRNLMLSNNTMTDCSAGNNTNYIYTEYYSSINGTVVTLLNNETVVLPEGQTAVNISVRVTDDMGNPISGGRISNLSLNNYILSSSFRVTDDWSVLAFPPAYGIYLVNASYSTYYANNHTIKTAVVIFQNEPNHGPYYVATNGSDLNDGTENHPFATIEKAIKAASQDDVESTIYIKNGTYNESNFTINKSLNIIGLGDEVIIDAQNASSIFTVTANNVNMSNIGFANAKEGNSSAVTWTGANGTLINATFINNTGYDGGALKWTGANGTLNGSTFINNSASNNGGALYYEGNLKHTNNTFIDNSAVEEGGAIFTNKSSFVDMEDSTFINNSAKLGGAVFVDYPQNWNQSGANCYNNSNWVISNSTFINNTAQMGGALVIYADDTIIENNTFISNNATRYGGGALITGGNNTTVIGNVFENNTAFLYAGAIGTNNSYIVNNTFINNSAYQAGGVLTINSTIINNTFIDNNASRGASIVYLDNYDYVNYTCNCSEYDYGCCDENCTCSLENSTEICNCTNHTQEIPYTILLNNTLPDGSVYVYNESVVLNVTLNYNGDYLLSLDAYNYTGIWDLVAEGYCIEFNASMPWQNNGTTGILVNDPTFIRNSLDGSYVGDYIRVLSALYKRVYNWNIKELVFVFTDQDYMNSTNPAIQRVINITHSNTTRFVEDGIWLNDTWYCGALSSFINPTTRQNLILINGCGDFDIPDLLVDKVANTSWVQMGDYVNYTVTVTNPNDIWLHDVTVKDIPNNQYLVYIDWNNTLKIDGTYEDWYKDDNALIWYLNRTLRPNETVVFNIIFKIRDYYYNGIPNSTRVMNNLVNASSYETPYKLDDVDVFGGYPYLIIRKDTLDTNVSIGDEVKFLITITNIGTEIAYDAHVYEYYWPTSYLNYIGWENGYDNNHTWRNSDRDWYLNEPLNPYESASLIVKFNATSYGSNLPNVAYVYNPNGPTNVAENRTNITFGYLSATKTVIDITGETMRMALTVTNIGNSTLRNVTISDNINKGANNINLINWSDSRGYYNGYDYNNDWTVSVSSYSYYDAYVWTFNNPLGPGGTATIILTFNTTNASGYGNSISVSAPGASGDGAGVSGKLTRYIGADKVVLEQDGEILSFLLTLTNNGNITLHDAYITEYMNIYGNYMNFMSWADSRGSQYNYDWSYSGPSPGYDVSSFSNVKWTFKNPVGPGGSIGIVLKFNVTHATGYSNTIVVGEKNGFTNNTVVDGNLIRYLGAYKTVLAVKDDIIQFMLTVTNQGNLTAHDVYIRDSLTDYGDGHTITLINWTDSRGSDYNDHWNFNAYDDYVFNFLLKDSLGPGGSASVVLTFNTTNASGYGNGISVGETNGFGNGTGTGGSLTRYLGAYKTVLDQKDDTITFMLTVTNQGNITANEVYISDTLSSNMALISWSDSRGSNMNGHWNYYGSSIGTIFNSATWVLLDPLGPGGSASIIVTLNTSSANGRYSNSISVGEKNGFGNGTGIDGYIYRYLGAYKTQLDENITVGEPVRFMLTVTNNGNTTEEQVYIQEQPGNSLILLDWSDSRSSSYNSDWTYDGAYKWTFNKALNPGASASIIVTFNTTAAGTRSNGISVGDKFGSKNSTGFDFNVSDIYLGAYKQLLDETIVYGEPVRFLLTVTNNGNGTAHNVWISESPSSSIIFLNWTDARGIDQTGYNTSNDWSYNGNYNWTYNKPLGPGASASIIVTFNVTGVNDGTINPSISNGITVGDSTGTKNGTGNGWGIEYIPLGIFKTAVNETPTRQGDNLSFIITVTNNGNGSAYGVWINETPDWNSLAFLSWTAIDDHEWTYNGTFTYEYNYTVYNDETGEYEDVSENRTYMLFTLNDPLEAQESANLKLTFNVTAPNGATSNSVSTGDNSTNNIKNATAWSGYITDESLVLDKVLVDENQLIYVDDEASFIITVTNVPYGPDPINLTNIFIVEDAPAGLVYVGFESIEGDEANRVNGTWTHFVNDEGKHVFYLESLAPTCFAQIKVIFNATLSGNFTNKVNGSSDSVNNTTETNFTVLNSDLDVQKIALNQTVYAGNNSEFMIIVTNTGDVNLTGIIVEESFDEGLSYVNFVDASQKWSYNNNTRTFYYDGVLVPGEAINFTVIFKTNVSGTFVNNVSAKSDQTANKTANNTTTVYTPGLDVVKVADDEFVYNGNTTSFTVTVFNTGDCALTGVFVEEQVPEGLVYLDFVDDSGRWSYLDGVFSYDGELLVGGNSSFVVIFNTTVSGNFTNVVVAGSDITGNETNESKIVVYTPDFKVEKIASGEIVYAGNVTSYTIRLTNTGDCDLTGVFVEENFDDCIIYLSYTNKKGTWTFVGNYKWTLDSTLAPGEIAEFEVVFNTTKSANIVNVINAGSNITGNKTVTNNNTTIYSPALTVEKITLNETVYNGEQTQFLIVVTNAGDCDLTGVYVIEKAFPGLKYGSYIDESGMWKFDGKNKWTYDGVLAAGENASFIVVFDTSKAGNFTNTVEAGSDQTGSEEALNTTEVIEKSLPPEPPKPPVTSKHSAGNLSDIKTGNPLLVLLLVLAVLGLTPLRRRK